MPSYAACGVPMSLIDPASAASNREGFRQFLFGSVLPLARLVETELSEKLGGTITLSFKRLMASDTQGRARSVKALVDSGSTLEAALALVLFDENHD